MQHACGALETALRLVLFVLIIVLLALTAGNVLGRYVLHVPLLWAEETTRFLLVWLGFLGAAVAIRSGSHLGFTLLQEKIGPTWRRRFQAVSMTGAALFLVLLAVQGFHVATDQWTNRSVVLDLPLFWPTLAVPVGSILMLVFLAEAFVGLFRPSSVPRRAEEERR